VRERACRGFRARFLIGWLAELPAALRERLPGRTELALAVEERARFARREVVRGRARRFLREGGAVRALARGPLEGFERRDASEWILAELARAVERSCWSAREDRRDVELRSGAHALVIAGRPARHVRAAWAAAARLDEHRLAVARPLALATAPRPFAAFELPRDARPLAAAGEKDRAHVARALGFLLGSLADRGLWIPDLELRDVRQDGAGRAFLCGVASLAEHRPRRGSIAALPLHAELGALPTEPSPPAGAPRRAAATRHGPSGSSPLAERWDRVLRARAVRGLSAVAAIAPPFALRGALGGLAALGRFTAFERRTLANLELALGPGDHRAIARGVRAHAARLALEWARLSRAARSADERARTAEWVRELVELDPSIARLRELHGAGRGVLIVTAHLGNWELLAARLSVEGFPGAVVGRVKRNDPLADWLRELRGAFDLPTLDQEAHPRPLLAALRAGGLLGLLTDLAPRHVAGELAPFFGRPALTMTAPAALARATGLPLVPVRCVARGARYVLEVEEPLRLDAARDRAGARADLLARMNAVFERWIRATPEQWAWYQPRWELHRGLERTPPAAARRARRGERVT
jgi:KDO2-lipid IV(A) lauroyltransferase